MERDRMNWDDYFFQVARFIASRSTCHKRQVGCVIVKDKQIVATGYNGAPRGVPHCVECARSGYPSGVGYEKCLAAHSEQNAICQAARHGISIKNSTLYVIGFPCHTCARMIINAGITKVMWYDDGIAPADNVVEWFEQSGMEVVKVETMGDLPE